MTTRSPSKKSSPKKSAAKPIAASKAPTFATFAPWKKVSLDGDEDGEGSRFDLLTATNDSVDYEDLFGEEPEHAMVCASSVKVDGDLSLSGWQAKKGLQQTVYVIDGDLSVDGTLVFSQSDLCTTLWVKGRVAASRVVLASSAMLICDALEVRDALVTYLEDAGHLIVHGPLVAKVWIDLAQGRGSVELDERPAARLLSDYYAAHKRDDVPRDDGDEDDERGAYLRSAFEWEPATIALRTTLVSDGEADVTKVLEAAKSGAALLA